MTLGVKHDGQKPRLSLLPWPAVMVVVEVLEFGARKYAPDNWRHVPDARRRYFDAAMRHLTAWWVGERVDAETGLSHLAHAACCILFLLALELQGPDGGTREAAPDTDTTAPFLFPKAAPHTPSAAPSPPSPAPPRGSRHLSSLTATQLRRLRWRVEHRVGRFGAIPGGLSWESIVAAGSPWASLVASRDASERDAGRPTGTLRDAGGTPDRDASGRPSSPSHSPSSLEIPEMEEEDARNGTGRDGTRDAGGTPDRDASGRDGTGRGTLAGRPTGTLRDNPLEVLARASGGRVSGLASATDQVRLGMALADVGLVGAELEAFGRALAGDGASKLWPKSEPARGRAALTVGFFLGRSGNARMLVDGVTRWKERTSAPPAAPSVVKAPAVDPAESAAEFRRLLAERRGQRKEAVNG